MEGLVVGRIVYFTLSELDAEQINRRRAPINCEEFQSPDWPKHAQAHIGNAVRSGDVLPMIITKVWNAETGSVNGKVFLDGNDDLWVTSVSIKTNYNEFHCWEFPVKS